MDDNELLYKLALSITPGIGSVLARNLVNHIGNVRGIFRESASQLTRIPGIGEVNARNIKDKEVLLKAEKEMEFVKRHGITVLFYQDEDFPQRFKDCPDAPVTCFYKGGANLDAQKTVAIVGTRHATDYGRQVCDTFIKELAEKGHDLLIVSGLAYGIDIQAHKSALKYDVPTIGVLGHGLDKMYPTVHAKTARSMLTTGGLLTDFPSSTKIDPANFIRRNRLIAGLSDATVVIESGDKGGALITAEIAASYHRDVFAFPGRATDRYSKGCNKLIQNNIAALIESADDLELLMGWEKRPAKRIPVQQELFPDLNEEEKVLVEKLLGEEKSYIDTLCSLTGIPVNRVSPILLGLEFKGVIEALPGNMYRLR